MSHLLSAGDKEMGSEGLRDQAGEVKAQAAQLTVEAEPAEIRAWEQVDHGRYMPRRIKGSCKGRALG
jgi:hypothetical protein